MAFRVEIEPQAIEDIDSMVDYIAKKSSFTVAERWLNSIIQGIASLGELPARCPVAPESEDLGKEVRVLLHGRSRRTYKIYYGIEHENPSDGVVRVFHVRHWARRPLTDSELEELMDDAADLAGED